MKVTLSGKQVDISNKLRAYVEEAVDTSVAKYFNAPISCTVAFSKDGENFSCEIIVHPAKNIVLRGSDTAADPYSAFDGANGHIATRLRRHKTKLNAHKGKVGLAELAYSAVLPLVEQNEEVDVNENAPLTIAETDANIPVCTVSEAVMFMDLSNECALMFRNSANNHISMVYRRKDGNIGWVEPKADN
jgi:ribosomal subunit interface protein